MNDSATINHLAQQCQQLQDTQQKLAEQLAQMGRGQEPRVEEILTVKIWQAGREYQEGDIVYHKLNRKQYICLLPHRDQNPIYYIPGVGYENMDAGRYWMSYPCEINTLKWLHLSIDELSGFLGDRALSVLDDHIIVGNGIAPERADGLQLEQFSSIPIHWHISAIEGFTESWTLVEHCPTLDGPKDRWFPNISFDRTGRYPRLIHKDMVTGLATRDHGVAAHLHGIADIKGQFWGSNEIKSLMHANGAFYAIASNENGNYGSDHNNAIMDFSSHRAGVTQTEFNDTDSERTRGDERDFYALIKVR